MTKRKDGRYTKNVYIGMKDTGEIDKDGKSIFKRGYKSVYGKSLKEVDEKASELIIKIKKGYNIASSNDPFKIWCDRLLKQKENMGLTNSYIVSLKAMSNHLKPLYDLPISQITMMEIQDIVFGLDLSKRTLSLIKELASQVFELAIMSRIVDFNPAKYVVIPKKAPVKKRKSLTKEQQKWVVSTSHKAQLAAMIMLFAGLRRGELTALTWGDIDFINSTIRVNKSVEFVNGQPILKDTKTEAGDRIVNVPDILIHYLSSIKQDSFYVIHMKNGEMYSVSAWRRLWQSYMTDLNIKYGYDEKVSKYNPNGLETKIETFTMHQLRHTFCSLLYLSGTDILVTKEQMGHSKVSTTLDIYTHLDREHKRETAKKLNNYLLDIGQIG